MKPVPAKVAVVVVAAAVAAVAVEAATVTAEATRVGASLEESDEAPTPLETFASLGLPEDMISVLLDRGITIPTPIQLMAIPDCLAGADVCGRAETGSGKTLAFGLPLLARLGTSAPGRPAALILVPTRELASQVTEALDPVAKIRGLSIVAVYGGVPMQDQIDAIRRSVDLVVATPGRLLDLMRRNILDLTGVGTIVIDEADQMADMGFLPQVQDVLRSIPKGYQTMLFSATLDGQVGVLVREYMTDPKTHEVESKTGDIVDTQSHRFIAVHRMDKAKLAATIINNAERSLVFVRTKRGADRVAAELKDEGVSIAKTHGDLRQNVRERSLDRFADGKVQALVATNVAARGLHIDDIDVVIHYDPPDDYKTFVHRSGRTARAGEEGLVVTLVEWDEILDVEDLQRSVGLDVAIIKMFSNDERLADLAAFEPGAADLKKKSDADLSRRVARRSRSSRSGSRRRRR